MYTNYQFEAYLNKHLPSLVGEEANFAGGVYMDKIYPQLKKGVIASLLSCRESIIQPV